MSFIKSVLIFCSILSFCTAFEFNDCYYDESTNHAAYICGVKAGENFQRRNHEFLYCNNYSMAIDRADIQTLSFPGCKSEEMLWNLLDMFSGLRILNISFTEIDVLHAYCLRTAKHLEKIFASHNHLTELYNELFGNTPNLNQIDFSYNRITKLDSYVFDNTRTMKIINFSNNLIEALNRRIFSNLHELETLDFSNNRIRKIENDLLAQNKKLKNVYLNGNQVKHIDCGFLSTLSQSHSVNISINTVVFLDASCYNGDVKIYLNISIEPKVPTSHLRVFAGHFQWIFNQNDFSHIRHLNLSNSRIENISALIQKASIYLETLDLSNNVIGKLSEKTFEKFINLKNLNLKQTNMTNFDFKTFYHQNKFEVLDISYNHLKKVDFYLFLRNFQDLVELNLEGNNLTEIDTVTRNHFPSLAVLGISKNNFSCDYLVNFLLQWHDLRLIDSTSKRTNVGGVDCNHGDYITNKVLNDTKLNDKVIPHNSVYHSNGGHIDDLFTIELLLGLILLVLLVFFITTKCKRPLKMIKEKLANRSTESSVTYNQKSNIDIHQGLLLPQPL